MLRKGFGAYILLEAFLFLGTLLFIVSVNLTTETNGQSYQTVWQGVGSGGFDAGLAIIILSLLAFLPVTMWLRNGFFMLSSSNQRYNLGWNGAVMQLAGIGLMTFSFISYAIGIGSSITPFATEATNLAVPARFFGFLEVVLIVMNTYRIGSDLKNN